jgi:hypothetical protein
VGSALETRQEQVLGTVRLRPVREEQQLSQSPLVTGDPEFRRAARRPGDVSDMVAV